MWTIPTMPMISGECPGGLADLIDEQTPMLLSTKMRSLVPEGEIEVNALLSMQPELGSMQLKSYRRLGHEGRGEVT